MKALVVALALVCTVFLNTAASAPKDLNFGRCQQIKTDPALDLVAFSNGVWFEISKTANDFEGESDCIQQSFVHDATKKKFDVIYSMRFENGTFGILESTVTYTVQSDETRLEAVFPDAETTYEFDILGTDTNSWAVIYSCHQISSNVIPLIEERIWVLSRGPSLSSEAAAAVEEALMFNGTWLGETVYETNQENCISK